MLMEKFYPPWNEQQKSKFATKQDGIPARIGFPPSIFRGYVMLVSGR